MEPEQPWTRKRTPPNPAPFRAQLKGPPRVNGHRTRAHAKPPQFLCVWAVSLSLPKRATSFYRTLPPFHSAHNAGIQCRAYVEDERHALFYNRIKCGVRNTVLMGVCKAYTPPRALIVKNSQ